MAHQQFGQQSTFSAKKILDDIAYPLEGLDISPFVKPAAEPQEALYDLYAVARHHGTTMASGHYTALARHPDTQQWLEYNDTKVKRVDPTVHMKDGGMAYVLFYRRRDD